MSLIWRLLHSFGIHHIEFLRWMDDGDGYAVSCSMCNYVSWRRGAPRRIER